MVSAVFYAVFAIICMVFADLYTVFAIIYIFFAEPAQLPTPLLPDRGQGRRQQSTDIVSESGVRMARRVPGLRGTLKPLCQANAPDLTGVTANL